MIQNICLVWVFDFPLSYLKTYFLRMNFCLQLLEKYHIYFNNMKIRIYFQQIKHTEFQILWPCSNSLFYK